MKQRKKEGRSILYKHKHAQSEPPMANAHYSINTEDVDTSRRIDSNYKKGEENYSMDTNTQLLGQDAKSTTEEIKEYTITNDKSLENTWERIEPYMKKLLTEKFSEQDEVNHSRISNIMKYFSLGISKILDALTI